MPGQKKNKTPNRNVKSKNAVSENVNDYQYETESDLSTSNIVSHLLHSDDFLDMLQSAVQKIISKSLNQLEGKLKPSVEKYR